ncbi:collagen alpha-1(XVI) chain-like [Ahaetulla prasina]|uniref:collagen alpha-1(XVI) chain-like n=1 Tax=Ahaetulla prasina TaxID=499056 RepID=UPI0026480E28|nr:collagen alpha-1(XVI) chain-like [Ahaetulla prasina]
MANKDPAWQRRGCGDGDRERGERERAAEARRGGETRQKRGAPESARLGRPPASRPARPAEPESGLEAELGEEARRLMGDVVSQAAHTPPFRSLGARRLAGPAGSAAEGGEGQPWAPGLRASPGHPSRLSPAGALSPPRLTGTRARRVGERPPPPLRPGSAGQVQPPASRAWRCPAWLRARTIRGGSQGSLRLLRPHPAPRDGQKAAGGPEVKSAGVPGLAGGSCRPEPPGKRVLAPGSLGSAQQGLPESRIPSRVTLFCTLEGP